MARRRCLDVLSGDRCEKPIGHEGSHAKGQHTWNVRDVPVPTWRKLATFRRDLEGVPW